MAPKYLMELLTEKKISRLELSSSNKYKVTHYTKYNKKNICFKSFQCLWTTCMEQPTGPYQDLSKL